MGWKKLLTPVLILIVLSIAYILYLYFVPEETMKHCETKADCQPVGCKCHCSGCGGFSSEDIVNKKYSKAWYLQHKCMPISVCPEMCCLPREIVCSNNQCSVESKEVYRR